MENIKEVLFNLGRITDKWKMHIKATIRKPHTEIDPKYTILVNIIIFIYFLLPVVNHTHFNISQRSLFNVPVLIIIHYIFIYIYIVSSRIESLINKRFLFIPRY